jgi:hypothetical protein
MSLEEAKQKHKLEEEARTRISSTLGRMMQIYKQTTEKYDEQKQDDPFNF